MYKAIQNKKYYLALERFPATAKNVSRVYLTGIRNWGNYILVYTSVF